VEKGRLIIGGIEELRPDSWVCYFTLPFIVSNRPTKAPGIDPLRAIQNCLEMIGELIKTAEIDGFATVWWLEEGGHGGFK
jgi:hypothetical protein